MIHIGVTGWHDHEALYTTRGGAQDKLRQYSRVFPIVEVDSSFYAIQPERNYVLWAQQTPAHFGFVVKAYQGMTGHARGQAAPTSLEETFQAFASSIRPLCEAGKLKTVLFQYPPWFDCTRPHVDELRKARQWLPDLPLTLEFRHRSWFEPEMRERTLAFMRQEGWAHSICDEPQAGAGSVPIVEAATRPEWSVVRFHGRNADGWHSSGQANWREVRYLYRYNRDELSEWAERLRRLQAESRQLYVLFNNNSGGDAAENALELASLLGLDYPELPEQPEQLDLFDAGE